MQFSSFKPLLFVGILCGSFLVPALIAEPVYLSDYLGVDSGDYTFSSNPPYTTINQSSPWGFGADILGSYYDVQPISFLDSGPFTKLIGAHPDRQHYI